MRNAFAPSDLFATTLYGRQHGDFIKNFFRRSLFWHLLNRFQNKLPVAHNIKTMRRENREGKLNFVRAITRFGGIATVALKCFIFSAAQ